MYREIEPGTVLGKWTIQKKLGDGGMSSTYAVRETKGRDRTLYAAKVIDTTTGPRNEARLRAEFETLEALRHANIVRAHEWGEDRRRHLAYFVMDYVPGLPLTEYVSRTWMSLRESLEPFRAVLEAVAYLHGQGVTHRDLKYDNILVEDSGRVTLIDFGIARGPHRPDLTGPHRVSFTPLIASPEQASLYLMGETADATTRALAASPRTDVYALGVLLYHLLTNEWPHRYEGTNEKAQVEYLQRVASLRPRLPASASNVPPALARVALAMLGTRDRPATADLVLPMFDAAVIADSDRLNETSPLVLPQFHKAMQADGMVPTQPNIPPPPPLWRYALSYLGSAAAGALLIVSLMGHQIRPPMMEAPPMSDLDPAARAHLSASSPQVLAGLADAGDVSRLVLGLTVISGPVAGQKRYPCIVELHETPWKGGCWRVFAMETKEACDSKRTEVYEPEPGYCKKYLMGYLPIFPADSQKPKPSALDPRGANVPMDSNGF